MATSGSRKPTKPITRCGPATAAAAIPSMAAIPLRTRKSGFLWDYALAAHKTVRVFGEYAPSARVTGTTRAALFARWKKGDDFSHEWTTTSPIPPLDKLLARNFPSYSLAIPDVIRAQLFLAELKQMEQANSMPNLMLLQLPSNHTSGTDPGGSTPKAMVADNDYAVGQIVEAVTKSKFWKNTVIFIVEDDAQNGVDHVDGHRTVALAISPYTRRGSVDSTFYSTQSMIKTIELILGLPTMSLFDLIAEDMRASFQSEPNLDAVHKPSTRSSIFRRESARESAEWRGSQRRHRVIEDEFQRFPDAAPTEKLNRILWHDAKGWSTPYPGAQPAVFAPLSLDVDDDDEKA